ncbi:MAG: thiamine biosynthesis protein ThiJ [Deltaproteobacteria bacterium]|nr:thiamine biosynthesis protein ThiJ [Deltaproteobacteria bacterium]
MARIWMPLPDTDYDTTESAVPWRLLTQAGHEVVFATEHGAAHPHCDPLLIEGVLFGELGAEPEAKVFYEEMQRSRELSQTVPWGELSVEDFDGLILPGGHAPGMRQYLGSEILQRKVAEFWRLGRPVGAICHGVLVLARAKHADTGVSVLAESRTTCLPKYMERSAHWLTAWKLGSYYRTYPDFVEDEVRASLADPKPQFVRGPTSLVRRGTYDDDRSAFVVEDGRYVSARWPGDAYLFARRFISRLPAAPG